ncbi:hypothetical protein KZX46_22555 (plasmid) [Polymorphobacter sp. PAMC 29334]|uniref:hypothetical protein n=1 Tax=Polymorphobacter sp. PAMC 29334 TaxID=2862331 RepID=UPI001C76336E|nr:hypothetical protein [Polymorphobacter sp. PAMC 29334]QYE37162.1 hypothetical protein KZX46_22555 [Polymorphobacter sp. PAMC 29334]
MSRKTALLTDAALVALIVGGALIASPAAADPIPPALTYADLFEPVPNAVARLDAADAAVQSRQAYLIPVQYWDGYGDPGRYHHHHHHHHHSARWFYDNGYVWNGYGWVPRPVYHHHHHHHHHWNY